MDEKYEGGCTCREVRYLMKRKPISGKGQLIARCPACHIALWSNYGGIGDIVRFIRVGTLDEAWRFPPDIHIFTSAKQPWVQIPEGMRAVPEYYKSAEVWPKESLGRREALFGRK